MKSKAQKRRERRTRTLQKYINQDSSQNDGNYDIKDITNDMTYDTANDISNYTAIDRTNDTVNDIEIDTDTDMRNYTTTTNDKVQVKWNIENIPKELLKYYHQRYSLFHKFDEIWIDYEGWYSVTPEVIAIHTAKRLKGYNIANSNTVDAFCGVGGNAIQFAKQGSRVLAIDLDETRLACARHNAIVYGVEELITFVCGDFMTLDFTDYPLFKTPETAVFLSPPWGGPSYLSLPTYNLSYLPIPNLHSKCLQISSNICYFMPRNMNEDDMIELGGGERVELEKMFLENKFKVLQCYYGDLVGRQVDFE